MRGFERRNVRLAISPRRLPPPHPPQLICNDNMPNAQPTGRSRRRQSTLTKQACDACKIRKVKCIYDESSAPSGLNHRPCQRCSRLALECTFNLPQRCRGPRRPRRTARHVSQHFSDIKIVLTEDVAAATTLGSPRRLSLC